jgi:hypothetical protein
VCYSVFVVLFCLFMSKEKASLGYFSGVMQHSVPFGYMFMWHGFDILLFDDIMLLLLLLSISRHPCPCSSFFWGSLRVLSKHAKDLVWNNLITLLLPMKNYLLSPTFSKGHFTHSPDPNTLWVTFEVDDKASFLKILHNW